MNITFAVNNRAALKALDAQIEATAQPFAAPRGARVVKAIRLAIGEEFSRGAERTDSGFKKWKPTQSFGTKTATNPPLGGKAGRVARAWAGGAGGFSTVSGTEIVIGVRAPWAAVHRGDNGPVTTIRPRGGDRMRFFLGRAFGVWISRARLAQGLKVPARPHATANKSLSEIIRDALLGVKA